MINNCYVLIRKAGANMKSSSKGLLIIIDGTDGSGKATQAKKLYDRIKSEGINIRKVEFPDYKSESSALVKMYLRGDFGKNPGDVNPYAASAFYASDRFASYNTSWKEFYEKGGVVISDRYTTSNIIYQGAKIKDKCERKEYLDWLYDLEYSKFGLPVPDLVFFLDMPPDFSESLIKNRANKITGAEKKDIHESCHSYMEESYKNCIEASDKYGWIRISCIKGESVKSIEEIHKEIYQILKNKLIIL